MSLELVILTSLKILAVHVCFQDGMIFARIRRVLEWASPQVLHKPAFECLTCMGGFWTIVFNLRMLRDEHTARQLLGLMLAVIGLNWLIAIWKDQFFTPHGSADEREL